MEEIQDLRRETRRLIRDLYKAIQDTETFESVLLPVKDEPTLPTSPKPTKEVKPLQVQVKIEKPKPIKKSMKHRVQEKMKFVNVDVLHESDSFFTSLQEFRKLYNDDFITTPEIPFSRKRHVSTKPEINVDLKEKGVDKGSFRITKELEIVPCARPKRFDEDISTDVVTVSIPHGVIKPTPYTLIPKSRKDYDPSDSIFLGDFLHKGYKPTLWSGRCIRPYGSVSLEHECVVHLRTLK